MRHFIPVVFISSLLEIAISDYHLFGPIKEGLRSKHYTNDDEIKTAVIKWLKKQPTIFLILLFLDKILDPSHLNYFVSLFCYVLWYSIFIQYQFNEESTFKTYRKPTNKNLFVRILCLMAYQPLWAI